ncbi:uncharacterized protein LOC127881311 [Dreissena polymorpha]|uniref:uncharacterized protein LOC127881311 n=1 Tax=Dreissena polymorpha TaxID=45954 RepID=UPI002264CC92|nr:uncharacterized protein LOC127881311 [Dreissena polymorpha]
MALTCCVQNCSKGAYWLNKWKKKLCDVCGCLHKERDCKCDPPFRLFTFLTKKKNPEQREKWKQLVGRRQGSGQLWSPGKDSRVCSDHFTDGEPTKNNPLPTVSMGYDEAEKRAKRMIQFEATSTKHTKRRRKICSKDNDHVSGENLVATPIYDDPEVELLSHTYKLPWFVNFLAVFVALCLQISEQNKQIAKLKAEVCIHRQKIDRLKNTVYSEKILKTDDDVQFYTGLANKSLFNKLHGFISPFVTRRWTGVMSMAKNVRKFKSTLSARFGPSRKVSSKGEFLMVLIKLRLGLLNKDLAKRFDISETLCSRIFFAWLRCASSILKSMIFMPEEEELISSKPQRFRKYPDLHSIIDCTELFIETPKDLFLQSNSWSDYKHHNTVKLLVACAPNSTIIFVSKAYLGRISDKAFTLDSGFLNLVPMNKTIMADKGFNISNECADRSISLHVPPGRRGKSQMSSACVAKTKHIANHRILIEQVIRRMKTFKILANEIQISLLSHVDDIVTVCVALYNLKEPIYKS